MSLQRVLGVVSFLLLCGAATGVGQSVQGTLRTDSGSTPIADASVDLVGSDGRTRITARTDASGAFQLRTQPGAYWIRVTAPGFNRVESHAFYLRRGDSLTVDLVTKANATLIAGVTVTAPNTQNQRVASFLQRQKSGFGRYFDQDFIGRNQVGQASMLLDGLVAGLSVRRNMPVRFTNRGRNCTPVIVVDGFTYGTQSQPIPIDEIVLGSDIAAVEVYTIASLIPGELSLAPFNSCGAVVIWTKFGFGSG